MRVESEIAEWYRDKAVFITGATGFMGKVLVEKLLRSCPDIGSIYVLVREKKNVGSRDRVDTMLSSHLFDQLRTAGVNPKDRLIPITGDVGYPNLGISDENRNLLQDTVSVVFHVAATVKFDESLRIAIAMNVEGTKAVLELCKGMTKLSSVVHVSTAYSNCNLSVIEERVYSPPADPDEVLQSVEGLDDDALEFATPRILSNHPNTYTFTKALAETVVAQYSNDLPIVIMRPAIVAASWKEPEPGWVDSFNGPTGLVVGVAKGVLKTVYGNERITVDLIPVDVCINLFIAAAWEIGTRRRTKFMPEVLVYNCVSSPFKPITWSDFNNYTFSSILKYAASEVFTVPQISMTTSRINYTIRAFAFQTVPAYLADGFIRFSGGKPQFQHYQSKLNQMGRMLEFFTTHEWRFYGENSVRLNNRLNITDKKIFDFNISKIDWKKYAESYFLGIRRNILKEKDDTIQAARKKINRMILVNRAIKISLLMTIGIYIIKYYII